jgi:hypothetical protein
MSFGAGVYINVVDMDVIFQMKLVSMYLELHNARYEKNTK